MVRLWAAHEGGDILSHTDPPWRDKTNFFIHAYVPETDGYEQMWCRKISDDVLEVCCIPFFIYGVSLGDTVRTTSSEHFRHLLADVIQGSGHHTFRVSFLNSEDADHTIRHRLLQELDQESVLWEWHGENLLAIDVEADHVDAVRQRLDRGYEANEFEDEMANPPYPEDEC